MPANPAADDLRGRLDEFVRYRNEFLRGDEKGEAAIFLENLFRALGHEGVRQAGATLEKRIQRRDNGKTHQRSARTLAQAKRIRSELVTDVERGEYRPDTKITLAAYSDQWIAAYAGRTARGIRPETLREYRRDLAPAIERFGRMRLAEIAPPHLRNYVRALAEEGLRPATIARRLAPVRAMFGTAMEDGLLRANPAAGLRIGAAVAEQGNVGEEKVKALTVEELGRLVAEVGTGSSGLLVSLLAQTGLRVSEGLGLRWQDVSTTERRIHVRQRIRDGEVGAPKSGRSRRAVPLAGGLLRELAAHRLASPWSTDSDLVFADDLGGPLQARNLYRWLKPAAERAGVPWAAFHTLRHTAASRWLHTGVTIAQVSRLLGHEDPAFTLRVYVSVLPTDLPDGEALAAAVGLA